MQLGRRKARSNYMISWYSWLTNGGRFRNLSGEKLELAKKVFKQNTVFLYSLGALLLVASYIKPLRNMLYVWAAFTAVIVWGLVRFSRHENFYQLRKAELKDSRKSANKARIDLDNYAKTLKENT